MTSSIPVPYPLIAGRTRASNSAHSSNSFRIVPISFSLFKVQIEPNLIAVCKKRHFKTHFSTQNSPHFDHPKRAALVKTLFLLAFSLIFLSLRLISGILLPDFSQRWRSLIAFSSQAEAKLRSEHYPTYLLQAVVAYEDRRFFHHFGVDPVGVARAVVSFSNLGGGSTITQQLVKNMLVKNERTLLRKVAEIVLALVLERKISKLEILNTYLCKIYWGHGVYGIESASSFYFGKHPSCLSLGECAMLVGMIPSPEIRSPFRDSSRGKVFQARVLRRMVEVGLLDMETALIVVQQSLLLNTRGLPEENGLLVRLTSTLKESKLHINRKGPAQPTAEIWDWASESKMWEVKEEMQKWSKHVSRKQKSRTKSSSNSY